MTANNWGRWPAGVVLTVAALVGTTVVASSAAAATSRPTVVNVTPNDGPPAGGNRVLITGTGFTQVTGVRFGSVPARSFTVASSTELSAVAPRHARGRADVVVETGHGTSAVVGNRARYNVIAPPRALNLGTPQSSFDGATSVSCPTASFCVAFNNTGYSFVYEHGAWQPPVQVFAGGDGALLSCASATFCLASDEGGNVYRWNGTSWSTAASITGSVPVALSCPTSTFCMEVDHAGRASQFNGTSWTAAAYISPGTISNLLTLSCPTSTFCEAVGVYFGFQNTYHGVAVAYRNGRWADAAQTVDTRDDYNYVVSCPTTTFCALGTGNGIRVWTGGASWSKVIEPADSNDDAPFFAMDCTSATFCVGEWQSYTNGQPPHWVRFDGASTADQTIPSPNVYPGAVSCWGRYTCQFVAGNGGYRSS